MSNHLIDKLDWFLGTEATEVNVNLYLRSISKIDDYEMVSKV